MNSKKHKKVCTALNYIDHFLILVSTTTVCVPIGITSSATGLQICAITAGIKKYESIIKKKETC